MTFREAVNSIMPLVKSGDDTIPFVLIRNSILGEYEVSYLNLTPEKTAEYMDNALKLDPYTKRCTGADFSSGSFAYVYDEILCDRLRFEYNDYAAGDEYSYDEKKRLTALINLVEDNASAFSHTTMDYLTGFDKPFQELYRLCPPNLTPKREISNEGWKFGDNAILGIIAEIERQVGEVAGRGDESVPRRQAAPAAENGEVKESDGVTVDGYEFKNIQRVEMGGITVALAENLDAPSPYLLYNVANGEAYDHTAFTGYVQALGEFLARQKALYGVIAAERDRRGGQHWLEPVVLTSAHCLPNGEKQDYTGKLVIVDPNSLPRERRYADEQLILCTHGKGANVGMKLAPVHGKTPLTDADTTCFRYQILGIADETKLPKWVKDKLALTEAVKAPTVASAEKPPNSSFLGRLGENKERVERDKTAKAQQDKAAGQPGKAKPAKRGRNDTEVS